MSGLAYLDTSAFVKIPLGEPEQDALRSALSGFDAAVSSALLRVEATRACSRYGPTFVETATAGLASVALLPLDDLVLAAAATLDPPSLRSLDALHLASALSLGSDLGAIFTYDARMVDAARHYGVTVLSPA